MSETGFVWAFRTLTVTSWMLWTTLVARGFQGNLPSRRSTVALVAIIAAGLAFLCPPVLSRDVFGYVAYGRLGFLHQLNPYISNRHSLEAVGDSSAQFLVWSKPLPYGPLWTLIATAAGFVGTMGGVYAEILAHKLLAGGALVAAAIGASALAEHREPGRGRLTFLAIGLNPLLLLEGPGTGHNDLVMVALLVWAAVLSAEDRRSMAALAIGLAIAVKPVAIVAVPALLLEVWLGGSQTHRRQDMARALVLCGIPGLLASVPFGGPLIVGRSILAQGDAPLGHTGLVLGLTIALLVSVWAWRFVRKTVSTVQAAWLTAWIPLSVVLILVGSRQWFPWYVSWALVPALAGWDERHRILTTGVASFGVLLTLVYTYRP
jgi:hypothetical protein